MIPLTPLVLFLNFIFLPSSTLMHVTSYEDLASTSLPIENDHEEGSIVSLVTNTDLENYLTNAIPEDPIQREKFTTEARITMALLFSNGLVNIEGPTTLKYADAMAVTAKTLVTDLAAQFSRPVIKENLPKIYNRHMAAGKNSLQALGLSLEEIATGRTVEERIALEGMALDMATEDASYNGAMKSKPDIFTGKIVEERLSQDDIAKRYQGPDRASYNNPFKLKNRFLGCTFEDDEYTYRSYRRDVPNIERMYFKTEEAYQVFLKKL